MCGGGGGGAEGAGVAAVRDNVNESQRKKTKRFAGNISAGTITLLLHRDFSSCCLLSVPDHNVYILSLMLKV